MDTRTTVALLEIVTIAASFAGLALFVHWLLATSGRLAEEDRAGTDAREPDAVDTLTALLSSMRASKVLEPFIVAGGRRNWFGIGETLATLDRKLKQAGQRAWLSPARFLAVCFISGLLGALIPSTLALLLGLVSVGGAIITAILGGLVGFAAPRTALSNLIANRVAMIEKRLPFAIEFLVLAIEARATFQTALETYCKDPQHDPLKEELARALRDMQYGSSPQQALAPVAERVGSESLHQFVVAVNSGLDTGQPLKEVLKQQARATRQRRFQSAEVVAKTASTRAIFPLMLAALAVILLMVAPVMFRLGNLSELGP